MLILKLILFYPVYNLIGKNIGSILVFVIRIEFCDYEVKIP